MADIPKDVIEEFEQLLEDEAQVWEREAVRKVQQYEKSIARECGTPVGEIGWMMPLIKESAHDNGHVD